MLFGSFDFLLFVAVAAAFSRILKPNRFLWRFFILAASAYFYWLVDWRFPVILAVMALAAYFAGLFAAGGKRVKLFLIAAITINLGALFIFKYYDFFRIWAQSIFSSSGANFALPYWELIFPVGISFYSFRMVSYLVDLGRKKYAPETNILDFFTYAFFFPYLLAGPITRTNEFLPQLKSGFKQNADNYKTAVTLFFIGLAKKLVISAWLSSVAVAQAFSVPEQFGCAALWLAVIAYSLVIYCDFSGYSDIAVASAIFMGFELSPNFLFPYRSGSIADFWRRWHISFYEWMRDYVYIPLGGSRVKPVLRYFNLLAVFLLSGLWHGAAWHFVLWGFWHGAGLCVQNIWQALTKKKGAAVQNRGRAGTVRALIAWLATFLFVSLGWILFKADTVERAGAIFRGLANFNGGFEFSGLSLALVLIFLAFVLLEFRIICYFDALQERLPFWAWISLWLGIALIIYGFAPQTVPPFIYFSF